MLSVTEITKTFMLPERESLTVLSDVTFSFLAGRSYAIQGPSGSGKSTFLAILAGLERPSTGKVSFKGQALECMSENQVAQFRARNVGFVFQSFHLLQHFSALGNVTVAAEIAGISAPETAARKALQEVGMLERLEHMPSELSGGEQQRVALARAIVASPGLLLCDEPTGNLDPDNADRVMHLLLGLQKNIGATLILVTHDVSIATRLQTRLRFERGKIVEVNEQ